MQIENNFFWSVSKCKYLGAIRTNNNDINHIIPRNGNSCYYRKTAEFKNYVPKYKWIKMCINKYQSMRDVDTLSSVIQLENTAS